MKCNACSHEDKLRFPRMGVLVQTEYEFDETFDRCNNDCFGRLGETQNVYACPKCGTLKVELKEDTADEG